MSAIDTPPEYPTCSCYSGERDCALCCVWCGRDYEIQDTWWHPHDRCQAWRLREAWAKEHPEPVQEEGRS